MNKSLERIYYCYGIVCDSKIVYIGKGKRDRAYTHLKGSSSCSLLNKYYWGGYNLEVMFFGKELTESQSLVLEASMVRKYEPEGNTFIPKVSRDIYLQSLEDTNNTPYVRQHELLCKEYDNPLVWVKHSGGYNCLKPLKFPRYLPLKWEKDHYRIYGKDLKKIVPLPEDMTEEDSLCFTVHSFI